MIGPWNKLLICQKKKKTKKKTRIPVDGALTFSKEKEESIEY